MVGCHMSPMYLAELCGKSHKFSICAGALDTSAALTGGTLTDGSVQNKLALSASTFRNLLLLAGRAESPIGTSDTWWSRCVAGALGVTFAV